MKPLTRPLGEEDCQHDDCTIMHSVSYDDEQVSYDDEVCYTMMHSVSYNNAQCVIHWRTMCHLWCTMTHSATLAILELSHIFQMQKCGFGRFFSPVPWRCAEKSERLADSTRLWKIFNNQNDRPPMAVDKISFFIWIYICLVDWLCSQRWVFKDCFRRHSDLCRREKPVSRAEVGIETGFRETNPRNYTFSARAGHLRYFFIFSMIKNDFFALFSS